VRKAAAAAGRDIGIFEPTRDNSDHVNFADRGIPAFRLLAGFERPEAGLRLLLTGRDNRGLVAAPQLHNAAAVAGAVLFQAVNASSEELAGLRARRR
jgi:hypothetical protein